MSHSGVRLLAHLGLIGAYATTIILTYFLEWDLIVAGLTLPWSMVVVMLGWMLIHAASYDLTTYMLGGGLINGVLLLRWALLRYVSDSNRVE